ncbi:MAG: ABC transporter ATP-binding protein [Pseudomonadota bacterium]
MAVTLENLWKSFPAPEGPVHVARGISLRLPARRSIALLGRNGAGKSSLLRLIAGTMRPDRGQVLRDGRVSWPVGFAGGFHGDLTGAQNVRFVARIYGADADALCDFVARFTDLGPQFHGPFRRFSSGMRARLAFGVSMGLPFDTYLVDEVTSVGDAAFRARSAAVLAERLQRSGAIIVTHATPQLSRLCQSGVVLDQGAATWHESIDDAIAHHDELVGMA